MTDDDDDPRYSPEVLRRFNGNWPERASSPRGPDVIHGAAGDREQGAAIELDARVAEGRIAEARFLAFGCPHLMAAASWLTERHGRASIAQQLDAWDWQEAARALGDSAGQICAPAHAPGRRARLGPELVRVGTGSTV